MPEQVTFDHYEVMRRDDGSLFELGRGAMGVTYKAFDTNLRIAVALKVITAASIHSDIARQRFVREARAAAKLRHRHVASVFHLGIEGDTYFYAMEFIDGETVESLIRRQGPLDPVLALHIATQVARALNAAQKHELVHRDIKPSNLMLVHEDEELVVKVIDFGLAKSSRAEDGVDIAEVSLAGFVGTPQFASPEQLEEKDIDVRSDIYSLGVTLWYMLAGRAPFAGTIAQVMSQVLREPPPLDQLQSVLPPVVGLLARMLDKDRARRPQTPIELRGELEQCLEAIAGLVAQRTTVPTLVSDVGQTRYPTQFRSGALIAGRYELIEDMGEGSAGKVFRARRSDNGVEVRLILLNPELIATSEAYTQLERELDKVIAAEHRNLLRVLFFERVENASFLIVEATRGFSLLEVLRVRRELEAAEVMLLLKQAAVAIDFSIQAGLKGLDLALNQIAFHFSDSPPPASALNTPLTRWPDFVFKLNPLGMTRELSMSETWAGDQTVVGQLLTTSREGVGTNYTAKYVQALAAIAYELLGGTLSPLLMGGTASGEMPRYVPLAALTEEGNEALRRALDPKRSFPSAQEFFHAMRASEAGEGSTAPRSLVTRPPQRPDISKGGQGAAPAKIQAGAQPPKLPLSVKIGVPMALLVSVSAMLYFTRPKEPVVGPQGPVPTPTPPSASQPPVTSKLVTPISPVALATPPPTPSRQQLLKALISDAEKYEAARDWARCLSTYVRITRDYPDTDIGRVRLEMILASLRGNVDKNAIIDFPTLRPVITEAARLEVISAMMILGEELRRKEPTEAFNWFCAAAARGYTPAFTQVGLMYSNGAGVAADLNKAIWWFQQASDKGDAAAKTCLGECYLSGRGVRRDERRAIEILQEAAELGDARGMNLLGTCYHQGIGTPKNFGEALRLFNEAQERGFLDGLGNLGVLYMNGDGVPADPVRGIELFQKGTRSGNSYCMYLYARCLEGGTGVPVNLLSARSWYKKSAELGNPRAIDWCRKNEVVLSASPAP